jgi:DEAD/DEAH box helicase domain-containing protein
LYDNMPGGAGLASQAHALGATLFAQVIRIIEGCSCRGGCPTCLGIARVPGATVPEPEMVVSELEAAPTSFGLLGRLRAAQVGRPPAPQAPMLRPIDLRAEVRTDALNLLRALEEAAV